MSCEAEMLALEAEVRRELMEELAQSVGACAKGSEATPAADSPSLTTQIGHEVCFSSPVLTRIQFVGSFFLKKVCWLILSRSRSVVSRSQLFESLADSDGFRLWVALCYWGYMQFTRLCLFLPTYMFRSCWNIFLLFILQFFVSFEPFQHCNILFYETYGISDVVINRTFAILTKETRFIMANSMVCVVSEKNI
jgi:hypothetical protein